MDTLGRLLFNLNTIANIPRGKKINTSKEFISVEDESPLQGYWRWRNADSRGKTVMNICREIRTVILVVSYLIESKYLITAGDTDTLIAQERKKRIYELRNIKHTLVIASRGVKNVVSTYEHDADVVGHLLPLIREINTCIQSIDQILTEIGEITELPGVDYLS